MEKQNFQRAKEIEKEISELQKNIDNLNKMNNAIEQYQRSFEKGITFGFYFSNVDYKAVFNTSFFQSMIYSNIKMIEIEIENLNKEFETL